MRRGLKCYCLRLIVLWRLRHRRFPDEEGTEIYLWDEVTDQALHRHRRFPDEEGTEMVEFFHEADPRNAKSQKIPR